MDKIKCDFKVGMFRNGALEPRYYGSIFNANFSIHPHRHYYKTEGGIYRALKRIAAQLNIELIVKA